jgi:ferredoxin
MQPTIAKFQCSACRSHVLAKLTKPNPSAKKEAGTIGVQVKLTSVSQLLLDMRKEEAEHNAKEEPA